MAMTTPHPAVGASRRLHFWVWQPTLADDPIRSDGLSPEGEGVQDRAGRSLTGANYLEVIRHLAFEDDDGA